MSTMLQLTREELDKHQALSPKLNSFTQQIVNAIPFTTVPQRMKAVIAVSQLTAFASQFNRKIVLQDNTNVPINAISFVVTGSGNNKDSSVKAARKCFKDGYTKINEFVKKREVEKAIQKAEADGQTNPKISKIYEKYMNVIPPIDIMPTTGPGLIKHINDIGKLGMTSGLLYSGEFSDELAYNQDMVENIKILSEVYDTGDKEVKYTKTVENRSDAIESQAVNALFVGSPGHILYDTVTKKKFEIAFMSKLARRSWFCYLPERMSELSFDTIDSMLEYEENIEKIAIEARNAMAVSIMAITDYNLHKVDQPITVSAEVEKLFKIYKRYNSEVVEHLPSQDTTYALIRRHLQWKALKLAGAYALLDLSDTIELDHYIDAIRFCEVLDKDMELFEHDMNKSYHERFADYMQTIVDNQGKATISIHDIKKLGFIQAVSHQKLIELVTLCSGYDTNGIYKIEADGGAISYESIIKTDVLGISFKPINIGALNAAVTANDPIAIRDAKHNISMTTAYGFEVADTSFAELGDLLAGDFAYSPFKFKNGVRGKDNIIGGTKWVVLDVDYSPLSASEAHFMLAGINHHVALSSDASNEFKYRVLIELDSVVDVGPIGWKYFYQAIAEDLALKVDPLPQSQIFFSYSGRPVMSETTSAPLEARKYLLIANEKEAEKQHKKQIVNPAYMKAQLEDPVETFKYAFDAPIGEGSRSMIRAVYHAIDLGADLEYCLSLLDDINHYWQFPMEAGRFEKLQDQVRRIVK